MKHIRSIFASIALVVYMQGCTVKTPAQTPNPATAAPATATTTTTAHPALWMVKGPHATVYLFGSVHLLPKDENWRTPQFDKAVASSQSLWLEVLGADDPKLAQPLILQLGVDAAHPLSSKLTHEQVERLDAEAKTMHMSEAMMDPMRPWLAAMTLSVAPLMQSGVSADSGVEAVLTAEFKKNQRPIHGFETLSEQFHYFADLPAKTELDYLTLSIDDFDKEADQFKKLTDVWASNDQDGLDHLVNDDWRKEHPEIYKILIAQRNLAFAHHIEDLVRGDGTSFVAVGAAHYVGPDGIIALLRKDGYTVVPM